VTPLVRREIMRAYVTRRLAHGDRYVVTRAYLSDGTIEERTNPGIPDDDDLPWSRVGQCDDLERERDRLAHEGWSIEAEGGREGRRA